MEIMFTARNPKSYHIVIYLPDIARCSSRQSIDLSLLELDTLYGRGVFELEKPTEENGIYG